MSKGVFQSGVNGFRAHGTEQFTTGKVMAKGGAAKDANGEPVRGQILLVEVG